MIKPPVPVFYRKGIISRFWSGNKGKAAGCPYILPQNIARSLWRPPTVSARADCKRICVPAKPIFCRHTLCMSKKSGAGGAQIIRKMPKATRSADASNQQS
jgi:hypothetical protein